LLHRSESIVLPSRRDGTIRDARARRAGGSMWMIQVKSWRPVRG
jgi:hypothetical protein